MNWEKVGKASAQLFLGLIEYSFKFCALVSAAIVLGTKGSFAEKISAGFGSLSVTLRKVFSFPQKLTELGATIHDYNTLTAASFGEEYGSNAINTVLATLNDGIEYVLSVYNNITQGPAVTLLATLLIFLTFYLLGWIIRFSRQQGKGSFLVQLERKLGDRIFQSRPVPVAAKQKVKDTRKPSKASKRPIQKPASNSISESPASINKRKAVSKKRKQKEAITKRKRKTEDNTPEPDPETLTMIIEAARS